MNNYYNQSGNGQFNYQNNGSFNQYQGNNSNFVVNNTVGSNSRKMLYITIAVAALFVAAISGTFAYFTASATATNAITGTIGAGNFSNSSLVVTKMNDLDANTTPSLGTNLIPMHVTKISGGTTSSTADQAVGYLNTAINSDCVDSNGYTACQAYRAAITLPKNSPKIPIKGTVSLTGASASNLRVILTSGISTTSTDDISSLTDVTTTYFNPSTASTFGKVGTNLVFTSVGTNNNFLPATTTAAVTYYYYFLVWLDDPGTAQSDSGSFTGTVTIVSTNPDGTESGKITATFSS